MPSIKPFEVYEIGQKPWGHEVCVAHTQTYLGKALFMDAGEGGALQYHVVKDETFFLCSGSAWVDYVDDEGVLKRVKMLPGESYHVPPGAIHRVTAIEDCVFFETSTPVFDDREAVLEANYGEPH